MGCIGLGKGILLVGPGLSQGCKGASASLAMIRGLFLISIANDKDIDVTLDLESFDAVRGIFKRYVTQYDWGIRGVKADRNNKSD